MRQRDAITVLSPKSYFPKKKIVFFIRHIFFGTASAPSAFEINTTPTLTL